MHQRTRVVLAAVAAALFVVSAAAADRVQLRNGRVLEGRVRELPGGEVEITSSMGTIRISGEMVAAIELAETLEERLGRVLEERPGLGAEEIFALARESRAAGAATLARRLLWQVLERDPEHLEARRLLGFRQFEGRWVTEAEWHQLRGEVRFRGEWMAIGDRAGILQLEAYRTQIAEQRRLESERRWWEERQRREAQEARQPTTQGIPYQWVWTPGSGVVLPPAFVPLPRTSPPSPPRAQLAPSRPRAGEPPPGSSPSPGRANRGRFLKPRG